MAIICEIKRRAAATGELKINEQCVCLSPHQLPIVITHIASQELNYIRDKGVLGLPVAEGILKHLMAVCYSYPLLSQPLISQLPIFNEALTSIRQTDASLAPNYGHWVGKA